MACRIASPPSACHPKSCPPAPLGRACGLRAPDTWRPVRLNEASWGDDICIGSAQATRVGAISAREMDVLAPGKKDTESPHFSSSEWCFWRRTSLSRNSSNGKSPRRFSLAFITSAKPEKGGHRLCLNRAWVRFPPSHAPPPSALPPCPSKRDTRFTAAAPPFFPQDPGTAENQARPQPGPSRSRSRS